MRLALVFLFLTQLLAAQTIRGIVLDSKTDEPIQNVSVYLKKRAIGTTTSANGKFDLRLKSKITKTDSLQFSFIGYQTETIALIQFENRINTIRLTKKIENLDLVEIKTYKEDLQKTIKFKTLASLKSSVYGFGSQIIGDSIYVISGSSSYLEDSGKRALQAINNLPSATFGDFIRESQNGFYYKGYSNKLQVYDIKNDEWSVSKTKFRKRAFHNINYYNNTLYSLGGKRLSSSRKFEYLDNKIEVFDMTSKNIIIDHTNPHQAINFASFNYEDNIIVMGGSIALKNNGEKIYTNTSHVFNITSGRWYELPKMTSPKETQGVIIDDKIYLVGGNNDSPLKTIESYNITSGTWINEGELFKGIKQPALTTHEHIIYIFNNETLLVYDTVTKILEKYKINLKLKNSKLHYYKNKLYIVGGFTENSHTIAASSNVYEIDLIELDKTEISQSKQIN